MTVAPSEVLRLAQAAGFRRAAGQVFHLSSQYKQAIEWLMGPGRAAASAAFDYVEETLAGERGRLEQAQLSALR